MKEIVIVGAGPVGLWTAIQIKKRQPDYDIYMYEKHDQYQRSHVLRLDHWSLLLYGKQNRSEREEQFYQEITGKGINKIISQAAQSLYIRTNDFESALKSFAKDLNIHIRKGNIASPQDVMEKHPNCTIFLAADGAKSNIRNQLLGENCLEETPLQHIVEIKYQIHGKAHKSNPLNEQFKTNKTLKNMAFEYVGKEKDGITAITIRFFLDQETYNAIPQATFKNPLTLESHGLPESLSNDLHKYIDIRKQAYGEQYQANSSKISKLTLALYAANSFAIKYQHSSWFLVGDAAIGVPYFRALNSGMILGSRLGQILTSKWLGINHDIDKQMLLYNIHRSMHIATEFGIARGKNLGLQGYDWFRKMSSKLFPAEWDFEIESNQQENYQSSNLVKINEKDIIYNKNKLKIKNN